MVMAVPETASVTVSFAAYVIVTVEPAKLQVAAAAGAGISRTAATSGTRAREIG
jgi:hypothetical protein